MTQKSQIGKINRLKVTRPSDYGVYLAFENHAEILLPKRFVPNDCSAGDELEVFVCYDSEDRLMATTEIPKAIVGEFALLKVADVKPIGTFLDWGLSKDLFLPFAEQIHDLRPGQDVIVYIYLDKSERIAASMRLERHLLKTDSGRIFKTGESVDLFITGKTELGFKAIINGTHLGVLFEDEVFQAVFYGQKTKGFIKKIRDDGKIDLALAKTGHLAAEDIAPVILKMLEESNGFLALNDKTEAETIYQLFGVSKKKYKMVLGSLYKKQLILFADGGTYLVKKKPQS